MSPPGENTSQANRGLRGEQTVLGVSGHGSRGRSPRESERPKPSEVRHAGAWDAVSCPAGGGSASGGESPYPMGGLVGALEGRVHGSGWNVNWPFWQVTS